LEQDLEFRVPIWLLRGRSQEAGGRTREADGGRPREVPARLVACEKELLVLDAREKEPTAEHLIRSSGARNDWFLPSAFLLVSMGLVACVDAIS